MFEERLAEFQRRLAAGGVDVALITDDDSVYYLTGYYDYLHMDFGRPTILVIDADGSILITPSMEAHMAEAEARVDRMMFWNDGLGNEWREGLPELLRGVVGIEPDGMPPVVRRFVDAHVDQPRDVTPVLGGMRIIKSPQEVQLARLHHGP